jgi:hypothetical protein
MLSILGLVLPAAALGQGFTKGDMEFLLGGAGASDSDFDSTGFTIAANLGYFFSNNFEGLIRQDLLFSDAATGGNDWSGATRVGVQYNFDMGRAWPFIGTNIGLIYGDQVNDTAVWGLEGGLKYFVNTTTFIMGMIGYDVFFEDSDDVGDTFDDGRFVYLVAIGFRW